MEVNGRAYNGKEFNSNDIDLLNSLIKSGYNFYVTNDTKTSGIDPWSGMPNNHLEYWAFKNKEDADKFANVAVANIFNPSAKNSVNRLDDLYNDRQLLAKNAEKRQAKDAAAAEKRREYNKNLPDWRKIRTQAIKIRNEYNSVKSQMDQLKAELDSKLDQLKQSLDTEGIKYSSIDDVLSKEFLKR